MTDSIATECAEAAVGEREPAALLTHAVPPPMNSKTIVYDDGFMTRYKRKASKARSPILFFHSFANGKVEYQGFLLSLNGDGAGRAQLFEWFMGGESDEIGFCREFLKHCHFYTSDYEMNSAYKRHKAAGRAG